MPNKKRIGIVTILKCNNYGAELQAFGLQRAMNLMGYDAEILDYLFYKHKDHMREACSKPFYNYPFKQAMKERLFAWAEKVRVLPHLAAFKARENGFNEFHRKNTRFSEKQYKRMSELYQNPPEYDVYCAGSDQVWNPGCYTNINPYFLTFAPEGKKRISFASSFGVAHVPEDAKENFRKGLNGLEHIGVREKTGARLVKELTGRDAKVVVDPTILLRKENWEEVKDMKKVPNEPYILLYVLTEAPYLIETAKKLAKEKGMPIYRICKWAMPEDKKDSGIIDIIDADPADFLGLYSGASYIITNAFHGTVFSIVFEKDFYCIMKKGKGDNNRMEDLCSTLGIAERVQFEGEFKEQKPIDYNVVSAKLEDYRKDSEDYIRMAIDGE